MAARLGVESASMRVVDRARDIERLLVRAPILALFVAACGANPLPSVAQGDPVSLYMQNLTSDPVEFTMRPVGDPAQIFGVDSGKVGAACVEVPADWQLAQTEAGKPPGEGAVLRVIAGDRPGTDHRSLWVSVTEAGTTSGEGVPPWWTADAQNGCVR